MRGMQRELVTASQIVHRAQINRATLTRHMQTGRITPVYQMPTPAGNGAYLFDPQEADAYIESILSARQAS